MRFNERLLFVGALVLFAFYNFHSVSQPRGESNRDGHGQRVVEVTSCLEGQGSLDSSIEKPRSVLLLVVVISAPNMVSKRQAIRRTWKNLLPHDASLWFVVGTLGSKLASSLVDELHLYNDMVLLNEVEESYNSLSEKLIASLSWAWRTWKFRFLMKVDDDTFVLIDLLTKELRSMPERRVPLYWGFFDGRQTPKRVGKWKEQNFVLCDRLLPYAKGGGYILSAELVGYITCSAPGLARFRSEDVAVGVWLAPFKLERRHDVRFDTEWISRGCDNRFVVTHKQSEEDMLTKYAELRKHGRLCAVESRRRGSYEYNWSVPPSHCCKRKSRADTSVP